MKRQWISALIRKKLYIIDLKNRPQQVFHPPEVHNTLS